MQTIRLTNLTKGVLVLPDVNNWNHINLLPNSSRDFTELEYFYYSKVADTRVRNGLLKKEIIGKVIDKVETKISEPVKEEEIKVEAELDDKPEFDESEIELAGVVDDEPVVEQTPKKKKKKNKRNQ